MYSYNISVDIALVKRVEILSFYIVLTYFGLDTLQLRYWKSKCIEVYFERLYMSLASMAQWIEHWPAK